jgi:hypothetical protein
MSANMIDDLAIHGQVIEQRVVRLRPFALAAKYRTDEYLVVLATGGFGCRPDASGTAVFVKFSDDDECRVERHQVERSATSAEAEAFWAKYLAKYQEVVQ